MVQKGKDGLPEVRMSRIKNEKKRKKGRKKERKKERKNKRKKE